MVDLVVCHACAQPRPTTAFIRCGSVTSDRTGAGHPWRRSNPGFQ
ncbi:hypothetical protein CSIRO_1299 [Bradyrhizobiaceae bacterium SG-6C]|nr:hypothetical protein CSIRO_1299 [Bradyrhizobiaceae bacterium SG-6C]